MWKEFTRERSARRGWTVATLSLTFIGTVGLAKIMVDVRTDQGAVVAGRQSMPGWPIAFTLPTDQQWRYRQDPYGQIIGVDADGKTVAYEGRGLSGGYGILMVTFKVMSQNTPPDEVAREMLGEDLGPSEKIAMGPLEGRLSLNASAFGSRSAMAFGCSAEGLGIGVICAMPGKGGEEAGIVRSVCESIAFKPWRERR